MQSSARYHRITLPAFLPEDWDVHALLAFANYVQSTALEWLPPLDADQPLYSPPVQLLSEVLDSLANISTPPFPQATIAYLTVIWDLMKQISAARTVELVSQLEAEVIKFTFLKIQRRVTSNLDKFRSILVDDLDIQHPFHRVRECVELLDQRFMRVGGVLREKPAADDHKTWHNLRIVLKMTFKAVQRFFLTAKTMATGLLNGAAPFLSAVMNQGLPSDQTEIDWLPRSSEEWEQAMERLVAYFNHFSRTSSRLMMNQSVVRSDCLDIAKRPPLYSAPVHCEVKLLLHLFNEHHQSTDPPKPPAYSYLGSSKLSCLGCSTFLSAFNEVFGAHFATKGTHSKAYWPWGFPHSCPRHEDLRNRVYEKLTNHWVPSYEGYMAEDSTAPSSPTYGGIIDEDLDGRFEEISKKWEAELED
ncbi:hypothetical protein VTN77DRAFT_3072 [Rasamsonia byssochlamydoides]|uniref:uncharacterized protein n=1 Tax=Rasamsonia byssochlamydoides TaxID=89139 RepID=UPI003742D647